MKLQRDAAINPAQLLTQFDDRNSFLPCSTSAGDEVYRPTESRPSRQ
jgi:hypothetical protein